MIDRSSYGVLFHSSNVQEEKSGEEAKQPNSVPSVPEEKRLDLVLANLELLAKEKERDLDQLKTRLKELNATFLALEAENKDEDKAALKSLLSPIEYDMNSVLSEIAKIRQQILVDKTEFLQELDAIYNAWGSKFINLKVLKGKLASALTDEIQRRLQLAKSVRNSAEKLATFNLKFGKTGGYAPAAVYYPERDSYELGEFLRKEFAGETLADIQSRMGYFLTQSNVNAEGTPSNGKSNTLKALARALEILAAANDYRAAESTAFQMTASFSAVEFQWSQSAFIMERDVLAQAKEVEKLVSTYSDKTAVETLKNNVAHASASMARAKKTLVLNKIKKDLLQKLHVLRTKCDALELDQELTSVSQQVYNRLKQLILHLGEIGIKEIEKVVLIGNEACLTEMQESMELHVAAANSAYDLLAALQNHDKSYRATALPAPYKNFVDNALTSHKQLVEFLVTPAVPEEKARPTMAALVAQATELTANAKKIQATELCRLLIQAISDTAYWHKQLAFSSLTDKKRMPTGIQDMLNILTRYNKPSENGGEGMDWFKDEKLAKQFIAEIIGQADARLKYYYCGLFSPRRTAAVSSFYKFLIGLHSGSGELQLNAATFKTAKAVKAIAKVIAPQSAVPEGGVRPVPIAA